MADKYVAPHLPPQAKAEIRAAAAQGLIPVYRIVPAAPYAKCRNCADLRVVYVSFLRKYWTDVPPSGLKPATWLDGDGDVHAGWRVIERTAGYECPACVDKPYTKGSQSTTKSSHVTNKVGSVKQATLGLAKELRSPEAEDWTDR
jgi:hypothetical protein